MRVRDAVVLGAGIAAYDYFATLKASLMLDLVDRLAGVAFAPRVAFAAHGAAILSVGLGDLLFASVFPLLMRRAYGRRAAMVSAATAFAALAAMTAAADAGLARVLPAMVVLWPLMLIQYAWWRRRGPERTTHAYLAAEPRLLDVTRV
jgi:tellurite resistance protein TehA-like permease